MQRDFHSSTTSSQDTTPPPAKRGGNTVICSCIKRDPTKHKLLHRHDKRVKKRKKLLKMKRLNNSRFPIRY